MNCCMGKISLLPLNVMAVVRELMRLVVVMVVMKR